MNPLIKKFREYGFVSPEIEKKLEERIVTQVKRKGEFFVKKGQVTSSLFLIENGLVRSYYEKDDVEINTWFGFENIILGATLPLFYKAPSTENIQFIETTVIHYIFINELEEIYRINYDFNTIGRKMAEEYCVILEERINSLQTQTAEERYHTLLKNEPSAIQRISLGYIASYLGIKQETLSRIRKKQT